MQINFSTAKKVAFTTEIIVRIFSSEDFKKNDSQLCKLAKKDNNFTATYGSSCVVADNGNINLLIGCGSEKKIDAIKCRKLGSKIFSSVNALKAKKCTVIYGFNVDKNNVLIEENFNLEYLCELAFGCLLQSYRFNRYFEDKKEKNEIILKNISFFVKDKAKTEISFKDYELIADNVFFARDLVSEPSNVLNPESYVKKCLELTKEGIEVEVLDEEQMQNLGMNALLGVGQGSSKQSALVVLKWNGLEDNRDEKPIAFVGKGVTFDTGGISIKPSNNMEDMKTDMAGSATVVSLIRLLAKRKAKVNAIGVVGLVENMPSGSAQRPGDVVKSMSGQTIEIINTDAEGRLVLADALYYTNQKFQPKFIIDLATLTGAIIVSLADVYAGLFSNDDTLSEKIIKSGEKTAELVWRLPIGEEYDDMINSGIADMKNVGSGRGAGSITAAQFLKRFIGNTKWAHLDIAGVAWKGKGDAFATKGATGFGVILLNQLVKDHFEK